jgi:hypothetical protein
VFPDVDEGERCRRARRLGLLGEERRFLGASHRDRPAFADGREEAVELATAYLLA